MLRAGIHHSRLRKAVVQSHVMSSSLWTHGLQHTRLPCPPLSPGVSLNSCPLSRWCYLTISSSAAPSPPALNLSQHQGLFKWVSSLHQVAKVLEFQLQHRSFQWTPRTDLLSNGLVGSPCSPRDSQESSPTPQLKSIILWCSAFFTVQLSHPYMTTGKTTLLTIWTFAGKAMSCFSMRCLVLS